MKRQRRTFSVELKLEAARLVIEKGYSIAEASRSLGVDETVLDTAKKNGFIFPNWTFYPLRREKDTRQVKELF